MTVIRATALCKATLAASLAIFLGGAAAAADPVRQLCFYVEKGLVGHVFMCFEPTGGPQAGRKDLCRGKYSDGNWFGDGGEIKDDSKSKWTQRICFPVTVAQYNDAVTKVNDKQDDPRTTNC